VVKGIGRAAWVLLTSFLFLPGNGTLQSQAGKDDPSFQKVQPVLAKYCIKCHGGQPKPKADLNLAVFASEDSVRQNRKVWKEVLLKVSSHEMPPEETKEQPTPGEREQLTRWVEAALNKIDPKAPLNPGRVTVRRLNRAEYANTVRDLTGIDFDPTEDFPSDDIGFGFDTIGDVLSLSPVHLEKYLAAAEHIVQRAFPADAIKTPENHTGAKYLEPAGANVSQARFRPVSTEKGDSVKTGPLFKEYRVDPESEYSFRFRCYAPKGPVKVAVLACGKGVPDPAPDSEIAKLSGASLQNLRPFKIVETIEIKAATEKEAQKIQVKLASIPGIQRMAVALVRPTETKKAEAKPPEKKAPDPKPAEGKPADPKAPEKKAEAKAPDADPVPELDLESFVLVGPMDPRPAFQRRVTAAVAGKPKAEQSKEILRQFASRAYRRPASDGEIARLVKLVDATESKGGKWEAGIQLALQAVLVSPKFLFRVELDDRPDANDAHPITEHQLASRLSYFVWSTMPDEELLSLAGKGQLTANLDKQVQRMLKDARARSLVDNFAVQWLQIRRIHTISPDGGLFPAFNNRLREDMLQETEMFVESVFREDRSILDLIGADYTFMNERLARHYGIADTNGNKIGQKPAKQGGQPIRGDGFVRVSLQGGERGGLITQASVLTVTSNPTRTSPVKRGRWVLEQILGTPPPPPPPNVPELNEAPAAVQAGSLRQRMEQHRANPNCANCHKNMDSIGFALENYNAVGAWRAKDGNFEIDAEGVFADGTSFKGFPELRKILLAKKDKFARCLAEKLMIFGIGRGVEPSDERALDRIQAALARDQYKFSTLVAEIVKSDPFRLRRGKNTKD
jgi:hypothetical protein